MAIQLTCSCGRKLQAQDEHVGRRVRCPACGAEMTVPKADDDGVQPAEVVPPARPRRTEVLEIVEDDDLPRRRPNRDEDDGDDDRPRLRSRREDDDEEDEDRPRRRRRSRDDEDDEDYDRRREPAGTSGKATAALVLGLLSFCLGLTALPAVILGLMSLAEIGRSRGRLGGKGLAIAGLVTACVGTVFFALIVAFGIMSVGEASDRAKVTNDLRQMVLALHNYNDSIGHLPDPNPDPKRGRVTSQLSWRVQLLPYLEQDGLYRQFHHNEPWDSPHNQSLLTKMPKVFAHPRHPEATAKGLTYYRVFTGPLTPFPPGGQSRIPQSFTDGLSNTILVVEAADPVPWTKPEELTYDPNRPLPKLGGHFRSGTMAGMADVSPHIIGPGVSEPTLRAAITASAGDVLGNDW